MHSAIITVAREIFPPLNTRRDTDSGRTVSLFRGVTVRLSTHGDAHGDPAILSICRIATVMRYLGQKNSDEAIKHRVGTVKLISRWHSCKIGWFNCFFFFFYYLTEIFLSQ